MGKLPAFQFYPGDWMKDPQVSMLTPLARGIWFDIICAMHEAGRTGEITGTEDQFSRISRCTIEEFSEFLKEISSTKVADVTFCNKNVTVINRRMKREYKEKEATRLRVKKYRNKNESNKNVTPSSSSSSSTSVKNNIKNEFDFNWDLDKKNFLEDSAWMVMFCSQKQILPKDLSFLMEYFAGDLELKSDYKPYREIQRHFTNWFAKKNPNVGELKKAMQTNYSGKTEVESQIEKRNKQSAKLAEKYGK